MRDVDFLWPRSERDKAEAEIENLNSQCRSLTARVKQLTEQEELMRSLLAPILGMHSDDECPSGCSCCRT